MENADYVIVSSSQITDDLAHVGQELFYKTTKNQCRNFLSTSHILFLSHFDRFFNRITLLRDYILQLEHNDIDSEEELLSQFPSGKTSFGVVNNDEIFSVRRLTQQVLQNTFNRHFNFV